MATVKSVAGLSAVDRIKAEHSKGAYRLTDDIVIDPPTKADAERIAEIEGFEPQMVAWLGEDKWNAFNDVLDSLEVALIPIVMDDFVRHIFGDEIADQMNFSVAAAE